MGSKPDYRELLNGPVPDRETVTVIDNGGGSARVTLMRTALCESCVTMGETVEMTWLPSQGVVVIDMESGGDE